MGMVQYGPHHRLNGVGLGRGISHMLYIRSGAKNGFPAKDGFPRRFVRWKYIHRHTDTCGRCTDPVNGFRKKSDAGIEVKLEEIEFHTDSPVDEYLVVFQIIARHAAEEVVPGQQTPVLEYRNRGRVQRLYVKRLRFRKTFTTDLEISAIRFQKIIYAIEHSDIGICGDIDGFISAFQTIALVSGGSLRKRDQSRGNRIGNSRMTGGRAEHDPVFRRYCSIRRDRV
ncbi:MAG: hypothetical protein BWX80_02267 [Candidatus Hydrogenedentes bacterium ADurb.Bin101]|nr:MAG: hypothetical protein BWX80_02267 [Candidatus Hydrogenedentes bacterium ADurb.Bin101]